MTYSIIAFDPETQMIGSAVASRWTGVGGCTQYFRPGVGFVNFQNHSYAQVAYRILDNLEARKPLENCVSEALASDTQKERRQCIVADLDGNFHLHSGAECTGVFHHLQAPHCAAAGNTLADTNVINAMVDAYESHTSERFVERLILALEAGLEQGGDARGQEAASIKAYKLSYPIQRFYPIDLRVDHDDRPLETLRFLYQTFGDNERRFVV